MFIANYLCTCLVFVFWITLIVGFSDWLSFDFLLQFREKNVSFVLLNDDLERKIIFVVYYSWSLVNRRGNVFTDSVIMFNWRAPSRIEWFSIDLLTVWLYTAAQRLLRRLLCRKHGITSNYLRAKVFAFSRAGLNCLMDLFCHLN